LLLIQLTRYFVVWLGAILCFFFAVAVVAVIQNEKAQCVGVFFWQGEGRKI